MKSQALLPHIAYEKNAEIYKVMANRTRLAILNFVRDEEHSVEEISQYAGARKANISQHLALLRHSGLVTARREGTNVYYKIIDPRIVEPCRILYGIWS